MNENPFVKVILWGRGHTYGWTVIGCTIHIHFLFNVRHLLTVLINQCLASVRECPPLTSFNYPLLQVIFLNYSCCICHWSLIDQGCIYRETFFREIQTQGQFVGMGLWSFI